MSKSYKLEDGIYIDDKSIIHTDGEEHTDLNTFLEELKTELKGTSLYSSTGSNASINLNESVENYDEIEILYYVDKYYKSVKIKSPNEKSISLDLQKYNANSAKWEWYCAMYAIEGEAITLDQSYRFMIGNNETFIPSMSTSNFIYIADVIGYKYQ